MGYSQIEFLGGRRQEAKLEKSWILLFHLKAVCTKEYTGNLQVCSTRKTQETRFSSNLRCRGYNSIYEVKSLLEGHEIRALHHPPWTTTSIINFN